MCCGTIGVALSKSHDVERVTDAGTVLNTGATEIRGEGGKKGYIYSSCCDLIHILPCVG